MSSYVQEEDEPNYFTINHQRPKVFWNARLSVQTITSLMTRDLKAVRLMRRAAELEQALFLTLSAESQTT